MSQRTDLKIDDIFLVADIGYAHYETPAIVAANIEILVPLTEQ